MILILISLAIASEPIPPPRTVNGAVLGTAEEFRQEGPKRICLESTELQLLEGETSYLDYLGIHAGGLRIIGPSGNIRVTEGDAWKPVRGKRVANTSTGWIERVGRGRKSRYLIWAHSDYSDRPVPRVWVEGDALRGTHDDLKIIERISITRDAPEDCDQRLDYGWDMILGEPEE